jgi:hypothetical protein
MNFAFKWSESGIIAGMKNLIWFVEDRQPGSGISA